MLGDSFIDKRKALFHWLMKEKSDIIFYKKRTVLQESRMFGSHNGAVIFSLDMDLSTVRGLRFLLKTNVIVML